MQLIQLLDGSIVGIESIETINGNLEIVIADKTAEEIQEMFQNKANLSVISLLTDSGIQSGQLNGYVCYSGLFMFGSEKRIILTKETDKDSMRITEAEANALVASMRAEKAEAELIDANNRITELETQITDTQLAITEIYENLEVQ